MPKSTSKRREPLQSLSKTGVSAFSWVLNLMTDMLWLILIGWLMVGLFFQRMILMQAANLYQWMPSLTLAWEAFTGKLADTEGVSWSLMLLWQTLKGWFMVSFKAWQWMSLSSQLGNTDFLSFPSVHWALAGVLAVFSMIFWVSVWRYLTRRLDRFVFIGLRTRKVLSHWIDKLHLTSLCAAVLLSACAYGASFISLSKLLTP